MLTETCALEEGRDSTNHETRSPGQDYTVRYIREHPVGAPSRGCMDGGIRFAGKSPSLHSGSNGCMHEMRLWLWVELRVRGCWTSEPSASSSSFTVMIRQDRGRGAP